MSEDTVDSVCGWDMFPSPGSLTAIKRGCICPPEANSMGRGNGELKDEQPGQRWIYNRNCRYHVIPMECATVGVDGHNDWVVLEKRGDDRFKAMVDE
ncbi:hypothetical protein LCGC14_2350880 [marine sediment metagenome]|uniref:Uncharacterized protein n=1 Tax=marine sediment metagenome TaxID=412755 RepID=A0A0F9ELY9_9ZZZZ